MATQHSTLTPEVQLRDCCTQFIADSNILAAMVAANPGVKEDDLKVIIVGGSVAGLTLAHCLLTACTALALTTLCLKPEKTPLRSRVRRSAYSRTGLAFSTSWAFTARSKNTPTRQYEVVTGKGDVVSKLDSLALIQTR